MHMLAKLGSLIVDACQGFVKACCFICVCLIDLG